MTPAFSSSRRRWKKSCCTPPWSTTSSAWSRTWTETLSRFSRTDKPQTITSFRHEDIPVAMGIVIDNSGSMREKRDKVNKAALNLVRSSNPQDEVFVVNFNDEYYLDQDFTANINKLRQRWRRSKRAEAPRSTTRWSPRPIISREMPSCRRKSCSWSPTARTMPAERLWSRPSGACQRKMGQPYTPSASWVKRSSGVPTALLKPWPSVPAALRSSRRPSTKWMTSAAAWPTTSVTSTPSDTSPPLPRVRAAIRTIKVDARAHGYNKLTVRTASGYYAGQERAGAGVIITCTFRLRHSSEHHCHHFMRD